MKVYLHPASQQDGACHTHLHELGRGNVDKVESSYSIYDYGDRRPNGGLPEDYLTQGFLTTLGWVIGRPTPNNRIEVVVKLKIYQGIGTLQLIC